jgi:hypothetical protein
MSFHLQKYKGVILTSKAYPVASGFSAQVTVPQLNGKSTTLFIEASASFKSEKEANEAAIRLGMKAIDDQSTRH